MSTLPWTADEKNVKISALAVLTEQKVLIETSCMIVVLQDQQFLKVVQTVFIVY